MQCLYLFLLCRNDDWCEDDVVLNKYGILQDESESISDIQDFNIIVLFAWTERLGKNCHFLAVASIAFWIKQHSNHAPRYLIITFCHVWHAYSNFNECLFNFIISKILQIDLIKWRSISDVCVLHKNNRHESSGAKQKQKTDGIRRRYVWAIWNCV